MKLFKVSSFAESTKEIIKSTFEETATSGEDILN
jgi:hypothetical protein